MLHQDDVDVIDNRLPGKENDGLQAFAERNRNSVTAQRDQTRARKRRKVTDNYCQAAGEDSPFHAHAQLNKQSQAAKAHKTFKHEIDRQWAEGVDSLDVPAANS